MTSIQLLAKPATAFRRAWSRRVGLRRARSALGGRLEIEHVVVDMPNRFVARSSHEGRAVFVKLRRHAGSLRREAEAHTAATELDLPAARLVAYLPGAPDVLVTEAVDGGPLSERTDDASWTAAGDALRRFHVSTGIDAIRPFEGDVDWVAGFQRRFDRDLPRAADAVDDPVWLAEVADRAMAAIRATSSRRALIHGDCQAVHVLVGEAGATFIDLDMCGVGDPWYDIAVLATYAGPHRRALIDGYDPALYADAGFVAVSHAYGSARLLGSVVWRAEHGFDAQVFVRALREHHRAEPA